MQKGINYNAKGRKPEGGGQPFAMRMEARWENNRLPHGGKCGRREQEAPCPLAGTDTYSAFCKIRRHIPLNWNGCNEKRSFGA
jgi:hypothetical protein